MKQVDEKEKHNIESVLRDIFSYVGIVKLEVIERVLVLYSSVSGLLAVEDIITKKVLGSCNLYTCEDDELFLISVSLEGILKRLTNDGNTLRIETPYIVKGKYPDYRSITVYKDDATSMLSIFCV